MEINKIILIGNGFDLAHGLPTSYNDFIKWCWEEISKEYNPRKTKDYIDLGLISLSDSNYKAINQYPNINIENFENFKRQFISQGKSLRLNHFFNLISSNSNLDSWGGIENEYYDALLEYYNRSKSENKINIRGLKQNVDNLNSDFLAVKKALEIYLDKCINSTSSKHNSAISEQIFSKISIKEIITNLRMDLLKVIPFDIQKELHAYNFNTRDKFLNDCFDNGVNKIGPIKTENYLFLNFNYTNTESFYSAGELYNSKTIHIHGELNNARNPIIFGYGDEFDSDYKALENVKLQNTLENVKSVKYLSTNNYKDLLAFIESEKYQVSIFGHSCSNSDRTLLNKIFEHENCISIKPYYFKWKKISDKVFKDNYLDTIINITRCFNDKNKLRDRVVNYKFCEPFSTTEFV